MRKLTNVSEFNLPLPTSLPEELLVDGLSEMSEQELREVRQQVEARLQEKPSKPYPNGA